MNWLNMILSDSVSILSLIFSVFNVIFLAKSNFKTNQKIEILKTELSLSLSVSQAYTSSQFSTISFCMEKIIFALGHFLDFCKRTQNCGPIESFDNQESLKNELENWGLSNSEIEYVISSTSFDQSMIKRRIDHVYDMRAFKILDEKFLEFHNEFTMKKYLFPNNILELFEDIDKDLINIKKGFSHYIEEGNLPGYTPQMGKKDRWDAEDLIIKEISPKLKVLEAEIRDFYNFKKNQ